MQICLVHGPNPQNSNRLEKQNTPIEHPHALAGSTPKMEIQRGYSVVPRMSNMWPPNPPLQGSTAGPATHIVNKPITPVHTQDPLRPNLEYTPLCGQGLQCSHQPPHIELPIFLQTPYQHALTRSEACDQVQLRNRAVVWQ